MNTVILTYNKSTLAFSFIFFIKKLLLLNVLLFVSNLSIGQAIKLDTSFASYMVFEQFTKGFNPIRVAGGTSGINLFELKESTFSIGGSGYSRYHNCLHNNSYFIDMEPLSNGNIVGLFQYDESCTADAKVVLIVDSTGNMVSEYYFDNHSYGLGDIIATDTNFHVYVQKLLTGEDIETMHLTFDFNGNVIDSSAIYNQRHYMGNGSYRGDRMVLHGDSLIVSFWDGAFDFNCKLAIFDLDLNDNCRYLLQEDGYMYGHTRLNEDTVTLSSQRRINNEIDSGITRITLDTNYMYRNPSTGIYIHDMMYYNDYIFAVNDSFVGNNPQILKVFDTQIREVYSMSIPSSGRFLPLTDSTFIIYQGDFTGGTYLYKMNLDSLRAITPSDTNVGIHENSSHEHQVTVYPNPTNSTLFVNFNQELQAIISLYSLNGSLILQKQVNTTETQLDVSSLPTGVYVLEAQTKNGIETQKVVIEK